MTASDAEARIFVAALADNGIPATINADSLAMRPAEYGGWVRVLVPTEHLSLAQSIIEEARTIGADVDWSTVDVGEPDDAEDATSSENASPVRLGSESNVHRAGTVIMYIMLSVLLLILMGSLIAAVIE